MRQIPTLESRAQDKNTGNSAVRAHTQARFSYFGLGLTLLLATWLRLFRLAGQSLWSDEGNSVVLAQAGWGEIASRTALDIHPPLYYWLLHAWMRIFGESEVAVRSLSALAGIFMVAAIYRLGTRLFNKTAGVLAAFIAAVSPFQVYYSQETRMYALLALLGALTILATVELARAATSGASTAGWAFLYILSASAGLYTHYAFPLVLASVNLSCLIWLWGSRRERQVLRPLVGWLILQIVPLVLYLPWLPVAWRQLTTWPAPAPTHFGNSWVEVWRILSIGPAGEGSSQWRLLGLGLLSLIGIVRLIWQEPLAKSALVLLYLGLPIGLTLAVFRPAYLKFLLVASPALCLVLPLGLLRNRVDARISWGGWLVAGLVVTAVWGPLKTYYSDPDLARDDYRSVAHYLEEVARPEDAIILNAAGQQEVFSYYYRGTAPVYPLPRSRPLEPNETLAELEAILKGSARIFALYWATGESDPLGVIEGWLDRNAFKATDTWVGNIRLVSYAAPLPAGELLPADFRLGEQVRLTGYQLLAPSSYLTDSEGESLGLQPAQSEPGEIVQVQLRWLIETPLDTRYVVFLQMLDASNHIVGQRDAEPAIPTTDWRPGRPVLDRHGLLIEPGTPPGKHQVVAGLYDPATGQRLAAPSGDIVVLGSVRVTRPKTPPSPAILNFDHPAGIELGPLSLLGYDRYKLGYSHSPDLTMDPGDPLHVVLYWQARGRLRENWLLRIQLAPVDDAESAIATGVFPAAGVDYPTTQWEPGEVVRAQFDLFVPGDAPPGDYGVKLGLIDGSGSPRAETFTLAAVSVE